MNQITINSKGPAFPFRELCKRHFDCHGFISVEDYMDYTGTMHNFLSDLQPCIPFMRGLLAGVKGKAWAWEPKITGMA